MLELVNRYAHGYITIPVILAFKEKGIFQVLKKGGPQTLAQLSQRLGANDGHLQVALRLLESLHWVSCSNNKAYGFEAKSESYRKIPLRNLGIIPFPNGFLFDAA